MTKTVEVSDQTWQLLTIRKGELLAKSLDHVIKAMLLVCDEFKGSRERVKAMLEKLREEEKLN